MRAKVQRTLAAEELGPIKVEADPCLIEEVHASRRGGFPTRARIDACDQNSGLYQSRLNRWRNLPKAPKNEKALYKPLAKVVSGIMEYFELAKGGPGSRVPWRCASTKLSHSEILVTTTGTSPDFVITGWDENFVLLNPVDAVPEYAATVSCLDAKLDKHMGNLTDQMAQSAVYSKQVFNAQPSRNFVRIAIFSEKCARLLHFDRGGVKYTRPFDIHQDPHKFVRLVLGLACTNAELIGFDTTIKWDHSLIAGHKTVIGRVEATDIDAKVHVYDIKGLKPSFQRRDLSGRGTIYWDVMDAKCVEALMKESWRTHGRTPEYELLRRAVGLKGVGQMIVYQDVCSIKDFRGDTSDDGDAFFLEAFKDAIIGHRNLLSRYIDVSVNNILLGKENSEEGWRRVLIDLDMAVAFDTKGAQPIADFRTGTRLFQSIGVLETCETKEPLRQTYLDDLESFFYVFCYILMTFTGRRQQKEEMPWLIFKWDDPDARESRTYKHNFIITPTIPRQAWDLVGAYWDPCRSLLKEWHAFLNGIVLRMESQDSVDPKARDGDDHYDYVLGLIQTAIDGLPAPAPIPPAPAPAEGSQPSTEPHVSAHPPPSPTPSKAPSGQVQLRRSARNVKPPVASAVATEQPRRRVKSKPRARHPSDPSKATTPKEQTAPTRIQPRRGPDRTMSGPSTVKRASGNHLTEERQPKRQRSSKLRP
ncbi:hypothetical protein BKA70DRAFT_1575554 [Coprinopsis sp. MPI-PUGE-AT-0042]|nr:hypothetical protein BKA70DRAFT_1575554 [Coprinopsis sp. MPI-PUGE-AT-0042]